MCVGVCVCVCARARVRVIDVSYLFCEWHKSPFSWFEIYWLSITVMKIIVI